MVACNDFNDEVNDSHDQKTPTNIIEKEMTVAIGNVSFICTTERIESPVNNMAQHPKLYQESWMGHTPKETSTKMFAIRKHLGC